MSLARNRIILVGDHRQLPQPFAQIDRWKAGTCDRHLGTFVHLIHPAAPSNGISSQTPILKIRLSEINIAFSVPQGIIASESFEEKDPPSPPWQVEWERRQLAEAWGKLPFKRVPLRKRSGLKGYECRCRKTTLRMYPRTIPPPPLELFRKASAARLEVSLRTFATYYAEGRIKPARVVGRSPRFSVKDLDNFGRKKGNER